MRQFLWRRRRWTPRSADAALPPWLGVRLLLGVWLGTIPAIPAWVVREVPRFASMADYHQSILFVASPMEDNKVTPVIIKGALSRDQCDALCDTIMSRAAAAAAAEQSPIKVQLQRQSDTTNNNNPMLHEKKKKKEVVGKKKISNATRTKTQVRSMDFLQAIDTIMAHPSNPPARFFCFEEGFFQANGWDDISHQLHALKEFIFSVDTNADDTTQPQNATSITRVLSSSSSSTQSSSSSCCWFQYFPAWAQPPSLDCLVLAGEGATSTLHRDPLEWTGTSLALEGAKIWRFLEPPSTTNGGVQNMDTLLESYRLPSIAWDNNNAVVDGANVNAKDRLTLSAGRQSDFSLYRTRSAGSIPSAFEWSMMDQETTNQTFDPNGNNSPNNTADRKQQRMLDIAQSIQALTPDIFIPDESADDIRMWTTVQGPGDFIIIPAHWWHQTYGLEPSLTVSSQRCSSRDAPRVLQHISDQTASWRRNQTSFSPWNDMDLLHPYQSVNRFFQWLCEEIPILTNSTSSH